MGPAPVPGPPDRWAESAAATIRERTAIEPEVAIVLGSGQAPAFGALAEALGADADAEFESGELPGYPATSVPGHEGRLWLGLIGGRPSVVFFGRIHHYEGRTMSECAMPVRVARLLGAGAIVLTAAVGGLREGLEPGTLVVGTDHLNFMGENPLRGWRMPDGSPAFVDLSAVYDAGLQADAMRSSEAKRVPCTLGVYAAMPGPTYETPAEVEFLRRSGADVVGMSVVPEAVPARALGMRVLGLFSVTNAVGTGVAHEDVVRTSMRAAGGAGEVLAELLAAM